MTQATRGRHTLALVGALVALCALLGWIVLFRIDLFARAQPSPLTGAPSERRETAAAPATPLHADATPTVAGLEREPVLSASVSVLVLAPSGERLSDGTVELMREQRVRLAAFDLATKGYLFDGVEFGRHLVRAVGFDGYRDEEREFDVGSNGVAHDAGATPIVIALTLRARRFIDVRFLTPTSSRLADAIERRSLLPSAYPWVLATADAPVAVVELPQPRLGNPAAIGVWRLPREEGFDGVLELTAPPPAFASAVVGNRVLASLPVTPSTETLDFVIAPDDVQSLSAQLEVCLVDDATNASITSNSGVGLALATNDETLILWPTNESGCAEFDELAPGPVRVVAAAPGYARCELARVELLPAQVNRVFARLQSAAAVSGTLEAEDGAGVCAAVWAGVRRADGVGLRVGLGIASNVPAGGWYAIGELPRGETLLVGIDAEGWAANPIEVHLDRAHVSEVPLVARRGYVVRLASNDPILRPARAWIEDANSRPVWGWRDERAMPLTVALAPGSYVAQLLFVGGRRSSTGFTVSDQPVFVRIAP